MRKLCVLSTAVLAFMSSSATAQTPTPLEPTSTRLVSASGTEAAGDETGDSECGCDSEDGCGKGCGKHGCGARNANRWFNCNCNGSYKFPVPPLYTYQWPGLYSLRRMTDYHSPWRFPAIKPYEEETPVRDLTLRPEFRQASMAAEGSARQATEESVSSKMMRHYQQ